MNIDCFDCGGKYVEGDESGVFECETYGNRLTRVDYLEDVANDIRSEGFDGLADRIDAAANQALEDGS